MRVIVDAGRFLTNVKYSIEKMALIYGSTTDGS